MNYFSSCTSFVMNFQPYVALCWLAEKKLAVKIFRKFPTPDYYYKNTEKDKIVNCQHISYVKQVTWISSELLKLK